MEQNKNSQENVLANDVVSQVNQESNDYIANLVGGQNPILDKNGKDAQRESKRKTINKQVPAVEQVQPIVTEQVIPKEILVTNNSDILIKTPLFEKKIEGTHLEDVVVLNGFEDLFNIIKEKGFEVKDVNDVISAFDNFKAIQSKLGEYEPKLSTLEKQVDEYKNYLDTLPSEMQMLHIEYAKQLDNQGGDWKKAMRELSLTDVDYSKNINSYSDLELNNLFNKKKYDKEDWEYLDGDDKEEKIEIAKSKFITNQNKIQNAASQYAQQQELKRQKIVNSIEQSALFSKTLFEKELGTQIDEKKINEARVALSGGLWSEFYNNDGTVKDDAVAKYIMAKDGLPTVKATIESVALSVEQQVRKQTNADLNKFTEGIVQAGTDKIPSTSVIAPKGQQIELSAIEKTLMSIQERGVSKFANKNRQKI